MAARFGWRLYRHFFKTYTEKVWGVPAERDAGRLGRPAHQEPVALQGGDRTRSCPSANQKDITSLIEEFQYPKYGPGMMWERCREKVEAAGLARSLMQTRVERIRHADGRAVAVVAERRRPDRVPRATTSSPRCRSPQLLKAMDPPVPADVLAAADDLQLPRLPHRRPGRARGGRLPGQLDLHPRPRGRRSAASRTSARGRRTWSRRAAPASASSTSCSRATRSGPRPTRSSSTRASGSWRRSASSRPTTVEAGYVVRDAEGLPDLRRDLRRQRRRAPRAGSSRTRPNVHPVGRNGMHKYNNQDHSMYTAMLTVENIVTAPTTTSGR